MSFSQTSGQAARRAGPWADLVHSATRPRPDSPRPQSLHPFLGTGSFPLDAPLAPTPLQRIRAPGRFWKNATRRSVTSRNGARRVQHRGHPSGPAWVHLRILNPVLDRPGAPTARSMGRHRRQQLCSRPHGTRKSVASPHRSRLGITTHDWSPVISPCSFGIGNDPVAHCLETGEFAEPRGRSRPS